MDVQTLSAPFSLTLVSKFMGKTTPRINEISPEFNKMNIKKGFSLTLLDNKHLLITLNLEEDFTRLWLKGSLFIAGSTLTLTKWSPSYSPEMDSPLVPCWVTFKKLLVMLFQVEDLYEISKLIGNPLRMDQATAHISVLTKAKVCIEVDACTAPPVSIVVEVGGVSHTVEVVYDQYPRFCTHCTKLGHDVDSCYVKHNHLKSWGPGASIKNKVNPPISNQENANVTNVNNVDKDGFQSVTKKIRRAKASYNVFGLPVNKNKNVRLPPHPCR